MSNRRASYCRFFMLIMVFSLLYSCSQKIEAPFLGLKVTQNESFDGKILIGSGQFYDRLDILVDDIQYTLGVNQGVVEFITVTDSNFILDGFKIGDNFPKKNTYEEHGFACIFKINDLWNAGTISDCNNQASKIDFFFQRE